VRRGIVAAIVLAAGIAVGTGCRPSGGPATLAAASDPSGASVAWPAALIAAQSDADRGRHAEADRTLREFAAEHARSPEAIETTYWRAVFMLDPANTVATAREAGTLLERYLASNAPLAHRAEAAVLQRIAKTLAAPREPAPARQPDAAREAEIKALKEELEQTKAELERIKKRVAPPPAPATPPPPSADPE
jgi:hypothetical protein